MPYSLLNEAWIPVRRASGAAQTIRPCDLTDSIAGDPILALDWPRADFRLAGLEFLIGMLATACPPADDDDGWLAWWDAPPEPDALQAAFLPFAHAFVLDGDGPRFMQDFENFGGETNRIETLLIDAPGGQTLDRNADHFVKRDAVTTLSRAAAAMALYTLQSFAPAGGAGNRVGLRGGGPLTTLAIPPWRGELPLWHLLWANVPVGDALPADREKWVFPWLAATRTSEMARITTPNDTHELQAYWGMARRIRLEFAANPDGSVCDMLGTADGVVATGWRQRRHGPKYAHWQHPLSPYRRQKPTDTEWLPVHGEPGGIGYRHWVGLLHQNDAIPTSRPAAAIQTFRSARLRKVAHGFDRVRWHLLAGGYDMVAGQAKARGFVESEMPVIEPGDPAAVTDFVLLLRQLIAAAGEAASLLGRSVRRALFSEGAKVALDAGVFAVLRGRFWDETENAFFLRAQEAAAGTAEAEAVRRAWLADFSAIARSLFAQAAPIDASGADRRPDRIAAAAKSLDLALRGYGKDGSSLFTTLGLPPQEKAVGRKPRAKPGKLRA